MFLGLYDNYYIYIYLTTCYYWMPTQLQMLLNKNPVQAPTLCPSFIMFNISFTSNISEGRYARYLKLRAVKVIYLTRKKNFDS